MPIHDWQCVPLGLYHHFHQVWAVTLVDHLNAGLLPSDFYALVDQRAIGLIPDVLTLKQVPGSPRPARSSSTLVVAFPSPRAAYVSRQSERELYATRANRVAVRNSLGELVAVIETVSPGYKDSRHALRSFVAKATELLTNGIHLLVIDLFPPTPRDPQGFHKAIWDEIREEGFELPAAKRLTVAAYDAGEPKVAYVEPVAVGEPLPSIPIFLEPGRYLPAPLEVSYQETWDRCPEALQQAVIGMPS